jgi:hypothetical protein
MATHPLQIGVFPGFAEARRAVGELRNAGFRDDQLGILGPNRYDVPPPAEERSEPSDQTIGVAVGAAAGAGLGAASGAAAGVGLGLAVAAGLMPPLGPVLAGGTAVALLASAGVGAAAGTATGTLLGVIIGLGIPEDHARIYEGELQAGRVLVTVRPADSGQEETARRILRELGGVPRGLEDITTYGMGVPATPY